MGLKSSSVVVLLLAATSFYVYQELLAPLPAPKLDINKYWGPSDRTNRIDSKEIVPFNLQYSANVIDELRRRLSEPLNLAEPLEGVGFRYGFHKKQTEAIVKFWRDDYLPRWEQRQTFLNSLPQFQTEVQGLKIHFIHTKSLTAKGKAVVPLLLLHGWPGSVREFYELIPKLIAPQKDLDVSFVIVAPSLPGYGFSDGASTTGLSASEVAVVLSNLMLKLGYNRFLVQGGDWGSVIGSAMATLFPENVIGYHSNLCTLSTAGSWLKEAIASFYPSLFIPAQYVNFMYPMSEKYKFALELSGYLHIHATKPDTIGIALANNPVGLAAYILEKFSTGTDPQYLGLEDGGLFRDFTKDALIDNLMIYHLSNSFTTSIRLYAETFSIRHSSLQMDRIPTNVPTGCARFRHDIKHLLDWQLISKYPNLVHSTYHSQGGHFIALQLPNVLHNDFTNFVRKLNITHVE